MATALSVFLLQLIVIIVASRSCAYLFKKAGQAAVMGEIVAGILLGPSFTGSFFPKFSSYIFPASSLGNLQMLSQVGLILFMFVIGMELDLSIIQKKAKAAIVISIFSIVIPYTLGFGLGYYLYADYAPKGVALNTFALFTGITMSITAFPVLARIIKERGLTHTKTGIIAITSAAIGDVAGWCVLAFVIVIARSGNISESFYTLIAAILYIAVMLFVIRPALKYFSRNTTNNNFINQSAIAVIFIVLLLSAYCCEMIGIHALFGAFITGLVMPVEWNFRKLIIDKIEDVALVLLLPLFFVLTGLRTQINLLNDPILWQTCALITLAAIVGKFGGSALAAKLTGEDNYSSLSIGALMNTRGLMELVILNIGYDLGILSPQIFTMMVLMALITTFMTGPLLNIFNKLYKIPSQHRG